VSDLGTFSTPIEGVVAVAPAPTWTFSVADLRTGAILADLPFDDVSYATPLNDAGGFSASLTLDTRLASRLDVRDLTTPARRCWYALRDGRPMYGGIIWTASYDSASQKVGIGGSDWWSYFDARRILPSLIALDPGLTTEIAALAATAFDNEDQNDIVRALVALAQSHTGGDIGIQVDASFSGQFREREWFGYDLKSVGDALTQLSQVLDGPDLRFTVGADAAAPGGIARQLIIGEPWLGQQGSQHVWEYGRNLTSYTWPRDGSSMVTRAFAIGEGMEQGTRIAWHEEASLYAAGWPLMEREASYTTVRDDETLIEHAEADQAAARNPIVLPTLDAAPGLAPHIGEYSTGDDARLIIKDPYWGGDDGTTTWYGPGLDTTVRIVDVQVSVSASNGESASIVCAPLVEGII
jgi:hypothetical protein